MSKPTRRSRLLPIPVCLLLSLVLSLPLGGCSDRDTPNKPSAPATAESSRPQRAQNDAPSAARPVAAPRVHAEGETAPRNANERPLPAFEGMTLAGTKLAIRDLLGSRVVLFFFNPEVDNAGPVTEVVNEVTSLAGEHNFKVVGIGVGSDRSTLSRFAGSRELAFPVIDDSAGSITRILRLRAPLAILGMDSEGYMSFGIG
ncbi:MAG: hypothetical protein CL908_05830, partial [Deltaproteobacteria bacterium]|nr:hypothetical protein [Deltaproteobacteria bacterium]